MKSMRQQSAEKRRSGRYTENTKKSEMKSERSIFDDMLLLCRDLFTKKAGCFEKMAGEVSLYSD